MIRRIPLYVIAAVIPILASANAADLMPTGLKGDAPVDIWSGFYFGVNGGLGSNGGKSKLTMTGVSTLPDAVMVAGSSCLDVGCVAALPGTAFGGGQIGFNVMRGSLLLGLEADLQAGSTGTAKTTYTSIYNTYSASADSTLDWFGTLRGRLGMVYNDTSLIYFTGGLAFGSAHGRVTANFSETALAPETDAFSGSASNSYSKTLTGYVLGGGYEHAFTPSWSMKAEYQFLQLGSTAPISSSITDITATNIAGDDTTTAKLATDHNYHTLRLGLNYHIHPGYGPLN